MRYFLFKIKHDAGTIRIIINGYDEESARLAVCKAEGCPESAILKCTEMYRTRNGNWASLKSKVINPKEPITIWLAIGNVNNWDQNPQTDHTVHNWNEAVAIAYAVSKIHNRQVRLSTIKGYYNQGHYYWHTQHPFAKPRLNLSKS